MAAQDDAAMTSNFTPIDVLRCQEPAGQPIGASSGRWIEEGVWVDLKQGILACLAFKHSRICENCLKTCVALEHIRIGDAECGSDAMRFNAPPELAQRVGMTERIGA